MHLLAHALLSWSSRTTVGQIAGDFRKGMVRDSLPPEVITGLELHSFTDGINDEHPLFWESQLLVKSVPAVCAHVVADVIFGRMLAQNWDEFCSIPLSVFLDRTYLALRQNRLVGIPELYRRTPEIIAEDWFDLSSDEGVVAVFLRLDEVFERFRDRIPSLTLAMEDLDRSRKLFERNFLELFPEVIAEYEKRKTQAGGK